MGLRGRNCWHDACSSPLDSRKLLPRVKQLLADVDGASVRAALTTGGAYSLDVDGTVVALTADDIEIRAASHESLALTQDGPLAVAIDTTLTPALRREGLAREVVRALNDHRKATGLAIADRIDLRMDASDELDDAITEYQDWVGGEVLANSVTLGALGDDAETLTVDGQPLRVTTRKVDDD